MRKILAYALILLLLPGCSQPKAEATAPVDGCWVKLPPLQLGSAAEYNVTQTGPFWTPANLISPIDWRIAGSQDKQTGPVLTFGTKMQIVVADHWTKTMSASGDLVDAVQISYWVKRPQDPSWLPIVDEWRAKDGSLSNSILRSTLKEGDGILQFAGYTRLGAPAVFTQHLWGQELRPGALHETSFPAELPASNSPLQTSTLKLTMSRATTEECSISAAGSFLENPPSKTVQGVLLRLENRTAFPTRVETSITQPGVEAKPLVLQLVAEKTGTGEALARIEGVRAPDNGLALGAPDHDLLPGTAGIFPTDWPTTYRELTSNPNVSAWQQGNPSARIAYARHIMGDPSTRFVDQWQVIWHSGSSDPGLKATLGVERPLIDLLPANYIIGTAAEPNVPAPMVGDRPLLSDLIAVHQLATGSVPEVLVCDFSIAKCGIGTHNGTNLPKLGSLSGAPLVHPGVLVSTKTGIVHRLQSDDVADFPPPHPKWR